MSKDMQIRAFIFLIVLVVVCAVSATTHLDMERKIILAAVGSIVSVFFGELAVRTFAK